MYKKKKRIAIINQRYGEEVNGGSEYYTKKLAEHLKDCYEIEVLTTTARDYDTWKPFYEEGETVVNGVAVRRFHVEKPRFVMKSRIISVTMRVLPRSLRRMLQFYWLKEQGPYCPKLIEYIRQHEAEYDTLLFVTYLYYPTAVGILQKPDKSILVPTAHDEYCIYFPYYRDVFQRPRGIVYLTETEKSFTESLFHNQDIPNVVAGAGIEVPQEPGTEEVLKKYGIEEPYIIYVGRVSRGKGCASLFRQFEQYKREKKSGLKLVMVGKMMMDEPSHPDICCLGFISEEDKYALMAGARALVLPSEFESLSLVVLESMALGVPVLVNGKCEVLKAHCENSRGGFYYRDYEEFCSYIERLLPDSSERDEMCRKAKAYVSQGYSWEHTVGEYRRLIEGRDENDSLEEI